MKKYEEMPAAYAVIEGSSKYPNLKGRVDFYDAYGGTVVAAKVHGVTDEAGQESQGFHGFHIHEGGACSGDNQNPFADAGSHYNPGNMSHPGHAGDLPPLLCHDGKAWMSVYTGRFYPEDIVGKTVIIHAMPDDFHTQPSGNAGEMIGCGVIMGT